MHAIVFVDLLQGSDDAGPSSVDLALLTWQVDEEEQSIIEATAMLKSLQLQVSVAA